MTKLILIPKLILHLFEWVMWAVYQRWNDSAALFQEQNTALQQFIIFYPSQVMRSKQRKTYKHNQQQVHYALTPNTHLKYQTSPQKIQNSSSNKPIRQSHPNPSQSKQLANKIEMLTQQNNQLRKEIIELKVHQFYHFDDQKLKELIKQLQILRKQTKKYKQMLKDMQLQNDFLKRTNCQLKLQLQKEIHIKTRDNYNQDMSKCTLRYLNNKSIDDQITHIGSTSGINFLHNTTLEDPFDTTKPSPSKYQHKHSRKNIIEKCLSPRRPKDNLTTESANQYLLYRRNKQTTNNLLQKLNQ